jgi:hypothetical protein
MAMDDWFFTQGLNLTANKTYQVNFVYKAASSSFPEKLAVDWGNDASSSAMSGTPIFSDENVDNTTWKVGSATFTPTSDGVYYVGFHGFSDADQYYLYVDDIQIVESNQDVSWVGTIDGDWRKAGNWSTGMPPGSSTNVVIPPGQANYPTITKPCYVNNITVQSSASGDGSIIGEQYLLISGTSTVQRYITAGKWHDFAAPVQGQTLQSIYFNGNPSVWLTHYKEADNTRTYLTDLTETMDPGAGFEIWVESGKGDITIDFTGAFQTNDVSFTNSSTVPISFSGPDPLGYNLVGNPFASAIDLDQGAWSLNNVDGTFWVWNQSGGGAYKDWNVNSSGGGLTNGIVPIGQGFFIHTNAGSPSFTIPADARVHSAQEYNKQKEDRMHVTLTASTNEGGDEVNILFFEEASDNFNKYDTRKMFAFSGNAPQIYSLANDTKVSLNTLPSLVEGDAKSIVIAYMPATDGEQSLTAGFENLDGVDVILEDLFTGTFQDMKKMPSYTFYATTDDDPNRFILHFNYSVTNVNELSGTSDIVAYAYENYLYVMSKGQAMKTNKLIAVYDLTGRMIKSYDAPAGELIKMIVPVSNTFVIVKVTDSERVYTNKVFIK